MHSLIPLSLLLTVFNAHVYALRAPLEIRTDVEPSTQLARRTDTLIPLDNKGNAQYIANITLGGTQVRVMLDTGSSDLWVNFPGTVPTTKDMGKSLTLSYAIGAASGQISSTQLQMDNFTIPDQAFLLVKDASSFSSNIHQQGYDGLMGLGPNDGSRVFKEIGDDSGSSALTRMFESDTGTDNYITFLLDRKNDPTQPFKGQFTVSEVVPGYEAVTSMPQLDVESVRILLGDDQHWQALTDKDNGIIGPDGNVIKIKSIVPKAPSGQLVTVFDSGFTFSQVPRDVSDAIYGRVQGAMYDASKEWWTVPCGQYLNLTFNFGGKPYPIHSLDVVDNNFNIVNPAGQPACIGAFQPITSAFSLLGNYDMIMGMSFLRNTYTLLDFGNWVEADKGKVGDPYIQLLSVTTAAESKSDFVQTRLGGQDTTNDPKYALLPADQMQHSPVSAEEKKKKYEEMILSRWPYIFAGCFVFVLLVTGYIVWRCCCRRRKDRAAKKLGLFGKKDIEPSLEPTGNSSYLPLKAPLHNASTNSVSNYGYKPEGGHPGYGYQHNNHSGYHGQ